MLNLLRKETRALRHFQILLACSKTLIPYQVNHLRYCIGSSGRFHQLVNNSKRRRDQQEEMKHEKDRVAIIKEKLSNREKQIEDLESRLRNFESQQEIEEENAEKLNKLYQIGLIDINGNPVNSHSE